MIPSKNDFIRKYFLPLLEPVENFLGKYGIHSVTVSAIPVIIILLFAIKYEFKKNKTKTNLVMYIIAIILLFLAILKYQFAKD